jgi:hypothetical protein
MCRGLHGRRRTAATGTWPASSLSSFRARNGTGLGPGAGWGDGELRLGVLVAGDATSVAHRGEGRMADLAGVRAPVLRLGTQENKGGSGVLTLLQSRGGQRGWRRGGVEGDRGGGGGIPAEEGAQFGPTRRKMPRGVGSSYWRHVWRCEARWARRGGRRRRGVPDGQQWRGGRLHGGGACAKVERCGARTGCGKKVRKVRACLYRLGRRRGSGVRANWPSIAMAAGPALKAFNGAA